MRPDEVSANVSPLSVFTRCCVQGYLSQRANANQIHTRSHTFLLILSCQEVRGNILPQKHLVNVSVLGPTGHDDVFACLESMVTAGVHVMEFFPSVNPGTSGHVDLKKKKKRHRSSRPKKAAGGK